MEERRVKRFQIGDSISPSSFVPVKRKSNKDPCNQVGINHMLALPANHVINDRVPNFTPFLSIIVSYSGSIWCI